MYSAVDDGRFFICIFILFCKWIQIPGLQKTINLSVSTFVPQASPSPFQVTHRDPGDWVCKCTEGFLQKRNPKIIILWAYMSHTLPGCHLTLQGEGKKLYVSNANQSSLGRQKEVSPIFNPLKCKWTTGIGLHHLSRGLHLFGHLNSRLLL